MPASSLPLCVDLDGTLLQTDTLAEQLVRFLQRSPLRGAWAVLRALPHGKIGIKRRVADAVQLDVETLPAHPTFLRFLKEQRAAGRQIILVTRAHRTIADAVARRFGFFGETIASEETNISPRGKGRLLAERFGENGYDYAGNALSDMPSWKHAREVIVVNGSFVARLFARSFGKPLRFFDHPLSRGRATIKLLRSYQWMKNALIAVPLIAGHAVGEVERVIPVLLGIVAWSFASSAIYILNDLADLDADRRHPTKRFRALAQGDVSITSALAIAPLLLIGSGALALLVGPSFIGWIILYVIVSGLYTLAIKRIVLLDVFILTSFYSMRMFAGADAAGVPVSAWLMTFSLFVFLSLAFAKRYMELARSPVTGRGYVPDDRLFIGQFGIASGFLSLLVFALYIQSPEVLHLYMHPSVLWALLPLLAYWMSRLWMKAYRGNLRDDPLLFAVSDRVSLCITGAALLIIILATR